MSPEDKKKMQEKTEELCEGISTILARVQEYNEKGELSEDEKVKRQKLIEFLADLIPILNELSDSLRTEMFLATQAFYYHVRERALAGDEKAIRIYNSLKPLYEQALLKQVDQN